MKNNVIAAIFVILTVAFFSLLLRKESSPEIQYCHSVTISCAPDSKYTIFPFCVHDTLVAVLPSYWPSVIFINGEEKKIEIERYYFNGELDFPTQFKYIVFRKSKVGSILISTNSGSMLSVDSSKDKSGSEKGNILCVSQDGIIEYDGSLSKIKGRGAWTWSHSSKKPYTIKLSNKKCIFGLHKAKSFNLLSNPFDDSHIRNWMAYNIAKDCGLPNSVSCQYVSLWTNGEYRGLYLVTDKVNIAAETSTKNGDFTGPFVYEYDIWGKTDKSIVLDDGMKITVKEPDPISEEQSLYSNHLFENIMSALIASDSIEIAKLLDLESFARYYLIQEFFYNFDAGWSSVFFHKDSDGRDSVLYAGPIWDMDNSLRTWWHKDDIQPRAYMLKSGIVPCENDRLTIFPELCKKTFFWEKVRNIYKDSLSGLLHKYFGKEYQVALFDRISHDIELNNLLWKGTNNNGQKEFDDIAKFANNRILFFDDDMTQNEEIFHRIIIDVGLNYPAKRHLFEFHIADGEPFELLNPDGQGLVFVGCYDQEGNEFKSGQKIYQDYYLRYVFRQMNFKERMIQIKQRIQKKLTF